MSRKIRRQGEMVTGVTYDVVLTRLERDRLQFAAGRAGLSKGELVARMLDLWEREERRRAGEPLFKVMGGGR